MLTAAELNLLIESELATFSNADLKAKVISTLRSPESKQLLWEYGKNESYSAWLIADLGERNVWVAYCDGGHGAFGHPWGLVFKDCDYFGMDSEWYGSLEGLFIEWCT